jgi:modification methylase
VQPLDPADPVLRPSSQNRPARVPFMALLEQGYLKPGQILYLKHSEHQAEILENGQLQANGHVGSIHGLGAQLKQVPSCNGWMQWYYMDEATGQRRPLDVLRKQVRPIAQGG